METFNSCVLGLTYTISAGDNGETTTDTFTSEECGCVKCSADCFVLELDSYNETSDEVLANRELALLDTLDHPEVLPF